MNTLQRYIMKDPDEDGYVMMDWSDDGDWVKFNDYRALAEEAEYQMQKLRDEIDELKLRIRDLNEDLMGASL